MHFFYSCKADLTLNNQQMISQQREGWQPRQFVTPKICFMESDCNRELLGSGCYGGGGYWVVLGILGVLLGTAGYCWVQGVTGY